MLDSVQELDLVKRGCIEQFHMTSVQAENSTLDFMQNLLFFCAFWLSRDGFHMGWSCAQSCHVIICVHMK